MYPTLMELGPWPIWAGVVAALLGAALMVYVDVRGSQAEGEDGPPPNRRLILVALMGAALGLGVWLAVNSWGPIKVRSWGTMLMVGFIAGWAWAARSASKEDGVGIDNLTDLTIAILVGALVGARVVAVVLNWSEFAPHPEQLLRIWEGGLSFHGGLIGGWAAGTALAVHRGLGFTRVLEFMPSVALGGALTRIGCFLNGCFYGVPTDGPLGVCFHDLPGNDGLVPRHPTQLYASALNFGIFFALVKVQPRLRRPWHVSLVYLVLYGICRFGVEFLRRGATAQPSHMWAALTQAQVASVAMFVVGGVWLLVDWLLTRSREAARGIDDDE